MDNESNFDKRQRDKETERMDTDTRIFRAHEYTRSLSQTITQTLSHPNTQEESVSVCVFARAVCALLLLKGRAAAERVSLWAGYLDQTSACRFGKHQSKWLCSAVGSPANVCMSVRIF
jgi:hypothetical protein